MTNNNYFILLSIRINVNCCFFIIIILKYKPYKHFVWDEEIQNHSVEDHARNEQNGMKKCLASGEEVAERINGTPVLGKLG